MITESSKKSADIVFLHGFTQTAGVWDVHRRALETQGWRTRAIDLPGHGACPPEHDHDDLWQAADLLAAQCNPSIVVGYSLGARLALHLALSHASTVRALVLFGAKLGPRTMADAAQRRHDDEQLAVSIEAHGVEAFVDKWLALSFNARLTNDHRVLRVTNRAAGLAGSLRHCGFAEQQDLRPRLAELRIPIVVVTGEFDVPGVHADADTLAGVVGATHTVVRSAGHSVPFERPDVAIDLISTFASNVG